MVARKRREGVCRGEHQPERRSPKREETLRDERMTAGQKVATSCDQSARRICDRREIELFTMEEFTVLEADGGGDNSDIDEIDGGDDNVVHNDDAG